jgi:hypothetical protein
MFEPYSLTVTFYCRLDTFQPYNNNFLLQDRHVSDFIGHTYTEAIFYLKMTAFSDVAPCNLIKLGVTELRTASIIRRLKLFIHLQSKPMKVLKYYSDHFVL